MSLYYGVYVLVVVSDVGRYWDVLSVRRDGGVLKTLCYRYTNYQPTLSRSTIWSACIVFTIWLIKVVTFVYSGTCLRNSNSFRNTIALLIKRQLQSLNAFLT